ncbi:uncharacterized membrane protein YgaE (UPF0421/DUF939 family) [Paenibacillus sp. DS2015]|uniref:hypothetical protein n=1 Tax=Paenibacillus sp. DS2015 TaxID=3373917 RepID=UPI003D1B8AAF
MNINKRIGASLGLLAGTTLGSGISFLFLLQTYDLVWCVTIGGVIGITLGIAFSMLSNPSSKGSVN